jgi:gluconokinase
MVVMGVSGCGKSSVGIELAGRLGWRFLDGDDFHPAANVAKMASGQALDDRDREGWLARLRKELAMARGRGERVVLACSALKRAYRDELRRGDGGLRFVHLAPGRAWLERRVAEREGHFMPAALLDSQLALLEALGEDEAGVVVGGEGERFPAIGAVVAEVLGGCQGSMVTFRGEDANGIP